jgi:hypothetical protein
VCVGDEAVPPDEQDVTLIDHDCSGAWGGGPDHPVVEVPAVGQFHVGAGQVDPFVAVEILFGSDYPAHLDSSHAGIFIGAFEKRGDSGFRGVGPQCPDDGVDAVADTPGFHADSMIKHLPCDVSTAVVFTALGQDERQTCVPVDLST